MLLRHSAHYLLARGVPGLVNFLALAVYTRLLAPADFGQYALVVVGVGFVNVVVFQWLRLVVARFLPACRDSPEDLLGAVLALFLVLAVTVTGVGTMVALWLPDPVWQGLMALAVPLLLAQAWFELNLSLASAQLRPAWYGRLLGSKAALAVTIGGTLAWLGLGAASPLMGLLVAHVLAFLLFGLAAWKGIHPRWPDYAQLQAHLRYGLPLTVTFALGWVVSGSDRLLLAWLQGRDAVGVYAAGYDLAFQSLTILLAIVNTAAYPLAVHAMEQRGIRAAERQLAQNGELIIAVAMSACAGLVALSPQLVEVIFGVEFRDGALEVLPWIAIAAALAGIKAYHFDLAFQLAYASHWQVATGIIAAATNVALNLVLIPLFGIVGAASATFAAFLVGAVSSMLIGRRVFLMPPLLPLFTKGVLCGAGVGAAAWVASSLSDESLTGLVLGLVCGLGSAAAIAWIIDVGGLRTRGWTNSAIEARRNEPR